MHHINILTHHILILYTSKLHYYTICKQIEKLEDVSSTLEQLWLSYNQISSLDGLSACTQLTTLYMSNNLIKSWVEIDKLVRDYCITCP